MGERGNDLGKPIRTPVPGFDLETQFEITLEEVATGAVRTLEFQREGLCQTCNCTGAVMQRTCPDCGGLGRRSVTRSITLKVPPGIRAGQAIRIRGEGEPGIAGGPDGDLHAYVTFQSHRFLWRENNHLVCTVLVSESQARLGSEINLPTLAGSVSMKIAAGTRHGVVLRLAGLGLPELISGVRGDLRVQIAIGGQTIPRGELPPLDARREVQPSFLRRLSGNFFGRGK